MADVPGKFFSATKVRTGVSPSSPGSLVGEPLPPVNPPGTSLNSVGLTMPSAFTVSNSPLTSNGTIGVAGAGTISEYVRGDGTLETFPSLTGFVPYTGATQNVDLGEFGIDAGFVNLDTTPTGTPTTQGTIFWDADDETVDIVLNGYTMKIGEDLFYPVKNQTGSTIAKGVAVRFNGTVGASGRLLIAPFIADGSVPSNRFMGVTAEEILNGEDGKVLYFGRVRGINTNAFNEGDILYASTTVAGGYQTAIPVAPNNIVLVAAVVTKSINQGTIFVRPVLASNLNTDEAVKITSVADKNLLQYQSGTGLWENKTIAQVLGGTSSQFVKGDGSLDSTTYQNTADKGQPNGYASLDGNGKVPLVQINDALIGNVNFQGLWNASTNTPTLVDPPTSGTKGYYYIVSTGGTFAGITFEVGDWIISNGTAWGKVDNTDAVSSVFGRTGNVVASNGDYNTSQVTENTNLYYTEARVNANTNVAANTAARHNAVTLGTANGLSLNVQQLSLQLATSGQNGALSSTDWTTFNNKENAITAGTTAQYFRGDKTFQTLNTAAVPESGNLYYTDARSRAALSFAAGSGAYNSGTGVITIPTNNNQITNGAGYITSAALGAYLPLAGGTMTGVITTPNGTFGIIIGDDSRLADRNIANTLFLEGVQNNDRGYINFSQTSGNSLGAINGGDLTWRGNVVLHAANFNSYAPTLGGTGATGTWSIGITGNAGTANTWTTARTITIGNTGKSVNGSANVAWSLAEIGAYAATNPSAFIALTALSGVAPIQYNNSTGAISITQASGSTNGFLSSTDWNTFNNKTSNVGTVTSVGLSSATSGVTIGSTPVTSSGTITLTIATASGSQNGLLSSTDWTTFNSKQNALTNPVTGTGTTNYLPKFTGSTTIGNSLVFDNGTNVGIGTIIPQRILTIYDTNSATLYQTPTSGTTANSGFYVGQTGNVSYLYNYNNFPIVLATNSVESVRLFETSQNVHIGPTPASDNGAKLQVSGYGSFTVTGDNTRAIRVIGPTNRTGYLGHAFGTLFIQNNNYFNGSSYVFDDITVGCANVTLGNSIAFQTGAANTNPSTKAIITNEGNLGLGVTPSNALAGSISFEIGASGILWSEQASSSFNSMSIGSNFYYNSAGSLLYKNTGVAASRFTQYQGSHIWYNAPSGTAGNAISFTQAMTLTSGGDLFIGAISDSYVTANRRVVNITGNNEALISFRAGATAMGYIFAYASAIDISAIGRDFTVSTGVIAPTERMRIFAGGNTHIGPTPASDNGARLQVSGNGHFSQANANVYIQSTSGSGKNWQLQSFSDGNLYINVSGVFSALSLNGSTGAATFINSVTATSGSFTAQAGNFRLFNGYYLTAKRADGADINILGFPAGSNNLTSVTPNDYNLQNTGGFNLFSVSSSGAATFSSSLTAGSFIRSGGTSSQYLMADGSVSTLTNAVTGTGTTNTIPKFTGTTTLGNSIITDSGSLVSIDGNFRIRNSNGFNDSVNFDRTTINALILNSSGNLILNGSSGSSRITCYGDGYFSGGIQTGNPYGTTSANWLLGRFLTETTSANGSIRVQIGSKYYNIAAEDLGTVPT